MFKADFEKDKLASDYLNTSVCKAMPQLIFQTRPFSLRSARTGHHVDIFVADYHRSFTLCMDFHFKNQKSI